MDAQEWETPVNLLATSGMKTMAGVVEAGIELSDQEIHELRLTPIGGIDIKGVRPATFWSLSDDSESHEDNCPVCLAARQTDTGLSDDEDVPF